MLNDIRRDQILLKQCFEEEPAALSQWMVDSYKTEVFRTIKGVIDRNVPGRNQELVANLAVQCTWKIYERYETVPSHFRSLKTQVRKIAFGYANAYLAEYLKVRAVR
jgi:hypothetical protein